MTSSVTFDASDAPSVKLIFQVCFLSPAISTDGWHQRPLSLSESLCLYLHLNHGQQFLVEQKYSQYTTHIYMQIQDTCLYERIQVCPQPFLVETWSDCSNSTHHQGPLMLEPTIVNSTVILVIPHLPPNCHVTATVQSQEVFTSSRNITLCEFCKSCGVPMLHHS